MLRDDTNTESNVDVQLKYFDEEFSSRAGPFFEFYERRNCGRIHKTLNLATPMRILEIGPGSGALLASFRAKKHDVCGLDLSPAVASAIKSRHGIRVDCESVEQHLRRIGPKQYDLIAICHTLEHFYDPLSALRSMVQLLKAGGRVYIAVPNMDSWHAHWKGWTGYEPYHLHYFTMASLAAAVSRAGFVVLNKQSYESLSGWPNTVFRTLFHGHPEMDSSARSPHWSTWRRTVLELIRVGTGFMLSPLRWLQARLGRGEELIVIAERSAI